MLTRLTLLLLTLHSAICCAQSQRGYERRIRATATLEDIVRQPDLWMMEVEFKQMRLVYIDVRDPKTGETKKEIVWYLAYRCLNRPLISRPNQEALPVNQLDELPGPRMFVPRFTLITYDNAQTEIPLQILQDDVIPEALPQIWRIEREKHLNSVGLYQELPAPVDPAAEDQPWIYGVATWRNVDPTTDFFKVQASGFSNGYVLTPGAGASAVSRMTIVQKFYRPGDEFDPNRLDFQFSGNPAWIMLPDSP